MSRPFDLLVRNTGTLFTADGPDGGNAEQLLAPIPRGAVGIHDAHVAWIGAEGDLPREGIAPSTKVLSGPALAGDASAGLQGRGPVAADGLTAQPPLASSCLSRFGAVSWRRCGRRGV